MLDFLRLGNNLINRYNRHGIEDSPYASFKQQLEFLYQDYGYNYIPKNPKHKASQEEFNKELDSLMQDFVESDKKLIDIFSKPHGKFKKFKQSPLHKNATKQDYIDFIEEQNTFQEEFLDLLEFDSEQIHKFYEIGKQRKMTTADVNKVIRDRYKKDMEKGKTIDRLAINIRRDLRKWKKEDTI